MADVLTVRAGMSSTGNVVFEELLVERLDRDLYRVLASPGLVLGVAADDTIRVRAPHEFDVVRRGGNLCVQIFVPSGIDAVEQVATRELMSISGRMDGKVTGLLIYTVPLLSGFGSVERVLNSLVQTFPGVEWYYGNVYDPVDGTTPLNWWKRER